MHSLTLPTQCPPATYSPTPGLAECYPCPSGSFNANTLGAQACTLCDLGTAQPLTGQKACALCTPGKFAAQKGLSACVPCGPGEFNNATGVISVCTKCQQGRYNPSYGASICRNCPLVSSFFAAAGFRLL